MFLTGVLAGVLGGLGLGGGTLLIPALSLLTNHNHLTLQLYNLLFFFPTGLVAVYFHNKNDLVDVKICKEIVFIALVGAVVGSQLSLKIDVLVLRKLFGAFILFLGIFRFVKSFK